MGASSSTGTPRSNICSNIFTVHPASDNPSIPAATLLVMTADSVEHRSIARFRAALEQAEGRPVEDDRIVVLPDSVHTAQLAADALGCEVGAIANSLLFDADGEPVLILTSGAHRVDTAKVAAELGVEHLRRAKPEFVREHTGQVIGGVSPIAHPRPIRTFVDPALRRHDVIWAAAGHPASVFSSTYEELRRLTGATEIEVA
jgi:prolyl-tRNA editing enzyme YbaK/EbsC (Cys-tRNA(Pro) deacylase)